MGIPYNNKLHHLEIDFEHDGVNDIVSLTGHGYQVEAFGKCFYYGYEFSDQVEGAVRSAFIKYVKFTQNLQSNADLTQFIKKAVDNLSHQINLYDYDLVVMPQSSSRVNQYMHNKTNLKLNNLQYFSCYPGTSFCVSKCVVMIF